MSKPLRQMTGRLVREISLAEKRTVLVVLGSNRNLSFPKIKILCSDGN